MKYKNLFKALCEIGLAITLLTGCGAPATQLPTPIPPTPTIAMTLSPTVTSTLPTLPVPSTSTADILTQTFTDGEYQYVMECSGEGDTTVLLLGGRATAWKPIRAETNRFTRTCAFDHIGSNATPLTAKQIANNVHTLVRDAGLTTPYVLVGFSVGGYIARLYASLYPEEVAGMVFLDSSHEDQNARFLAALPPATPDECQELKDYRTELQGPHMIPIGPEITLDFDASADEVRAIEQDLGNLPLVVLTAGRSEWPDCFPAEVAQQLDQAWINMQQELKNLSSNSVQMVAKESGHAFDDPVGMQGVIESIRRVIEAVRNGISIP